MGEILINQLFAGAYLQEGTNIGHEVINLFRDDNDENYLYITPMGNVKGHNVDKVLFVQNIAGRETMEVVMKAEGLSNTSADDVQKIFYAGVDITDIFNKNLYHGEAETSKTNSMATYCAKDVRFPKKGKRIIITVDSSYEVEDEKNTVVIRLDFNKKKIVGQSMRTYLSEELYPSIHAKNAVIIVITGKQMPTPVSAVAPAPGILPIYIRSTALYNRFRSCANVIGIETSRIFRYTFPFEKSV